MKFLALIWLVAGKLRHQQTGGGRKGGFVGLLMISLGLGVTSMAAIGSLAAAMMAGMQQHGAELLGGDVKIAVSQREFSPAEKSWLQAHSQQVIFGATTRAMVRVGNANPTAAQPSQTSQPSQTRQTSHLVEVTLVDSEHYPLIGASHFAPLTDAPTPKNLAQYLADNGALLGKELVTQGQFKPGASLQLGGWHGILQGVIQDNNAAGDGRPRLAPGMLIDLRAMDATDLTRAGNLFSSLAWLRLPPGLTPPQFRQALQQAWPEAGWHVQDRDDPRPGLRRFLDWVQSFLTLAGLSALLLGGMAVTHGLVHRIQRREADFALIKLLGGTPTLVVLAEALNISRLLVTALLVGLAVGAAIPFGLEWLLRYQDWSLGVPILAHIAWQKLAMAGGFGGLVAILALVEPLARVVALRPALLFRPQQTSLAAAGRTWFERLDPRRLGLRRLLVMAGWMAVAGLTSVAFHPWGLGLVFFLVLGLGYGMFRGLAYGLTKICGKIRPYFAPWPILNLALSRLARPRRGFIAVFAAMGLSLSLVSLAVFIGLALHQALGEQIPAQAPSHFFIDIGQAQKSNFLQTLDRFGVKNTTSSASPNRPPQFLIAPSIRGRITALNGVAIEKITIPPNLAWAVESDRGLSWSADIPYGSRLVMGNWWQAEDFGTPLISLEESLAYGFGLKLGDSMTLTILGRPITARIANLRRVNWLSLSLNHAILFAPGALEATPYNYIATAIVPPTQEAEFMTQMGQDFPNITIVSIREVVQQLLAMMRALEQGARLIAVMVVMTALLAVGQVIMTWLPDRTRDLGVCQMLGATRKMMLFSVAVEFALVGLVASCLAVEIGLIGAALVVKFVFGLPLDLATAHFAWRGLAVMGIGVVAALGVGVGVSYFSLRQPLAGLLRGE
ncbi:MAG: hypothetical protein QM537_02325 [Candidatus Symbiobacter sp.]|nr:hypothetical protein [Candidatus Symbiobacter sp.]